MVKEYKAVVDFNIEDNTFKAGDILTVDEDVAEMLGEKVVLVETLPEATEATETNVVDETVETTTDDTLKSPDAENEGIEAREGRVTDVDNNTGLGTN